MIEEISFEQIMDYWTFGLWAKYAAKGYKINRTNTTSQKNYCYRVIEYLTQEQIDTLLKPIYIGYNDDGIIVGVESGYRTNLDYFRVRGLWVNPNYRGQGIATQLIKYFEDRCKEKYLWTIPRESALGFYIKYGFAITGKSVKTIYGQNYFAVKEIR
jgi:GNAT superfamily N-acetyltransferase